MSQNDFFFDDYEEFAQAHSRLTEEERYELLFGQVDEKGQ